MVYEFPNNNNLTESGDHDFYEEDSLPEGMLDESKDRTAFNKPWKTRHKVISNAGNSLWSPKGNCRWISVAGRRVTLPPTKFLALTEPEQEAFKYVALHKLQACSLGTTITIPKDDDFQNNAFKKFRRSFSIRRKGSATFNLFSDRDKDGSGHVFGLPLNKSVSNNANSQQQVFSQPPRVRTRRTSAPTNMLHTKRHYRRRSSSTNSNTSTCSNQSDCDTTLTSSLPSNGHFDVYNRHLTEIDPPNWKSRLIDALTLTSSSASASCLIDRGSQLKPLPVQVPDFVVKAVEFLELHALEILGIFRTGGSKKRVKHLREQIDSGAKSEFDNDDNPLEVASLLKEFFRDLPEPLLTRDLYSAFIATQKLDSREEQYQCLKLLVGLLPAANRDTLQYLLKFLDKVTAYSEDFIAPDGRMVPGNKMNSRNLATLFGPNILHKVKSQHLHDYLVEDLARAEESNEIIHVVQDMIDHQSTLFEISSDWYDELMRYLLATDPELVDCILKRFPASMMTSRTNSEDEPPVINKSDSYEDAGRPPNNLVLERAFSAPSRSRSDIILRRQMENSDFKRSTSARERSNNSSTRTRSFINALGEDCETGQCISFQSRPLRQIPLPEDSIVSSHSAANFAFASRSPRTSKRSDVNRLIFSNSRTTSGESESPSPSSISCSNYSTPPQSPPSSSNSTPFYTASSCESSPPYGNSPPRLSLLSDETPITLVRSILLEEDQIRRPVYTTISARKLPNDLHQQQWNQWEVMTAEISDEKDFLEQETLV